MARLFGTDGIRGLAGRDLTHELAYSVGRAAVGALSGGGLSFVLGRDTRASSESLEAAVAEGIASAGGEAQSAGVAPTPAVAFLTVALGARAGVVISASHNPPEYNGIKFFSDRGMKLPDALEDEIERLVKLGNGSTLSGAAPARSAPGGDARYLEHLAEAALVSLAGMRVVVDPANGAAHRLAPEALRRLGAEVQPIHDRPDGTNINVGCGATHPEVVSEAVRRIGADAGVALDGDADRAILCDADGLIVDGDQILAACALAMQEEGSLRGGRVVATVMANLGFHRAMDGAGIEVVETKVGDRYVLEEMLRKDAVLGGEQSGHVIFRDLATTGDGILTAVRFLSLARKKGVTVAELAGSMRRFPQVLENVRVQDREALEGAGAVWEAVAAAERNLGDRGRVLVRPSGTEPLVRVMVEAETEEEARTHADAIADAVRAALASA